MTNRGRPRKPTALKIAEGDRGKRKPSLEQEPQFREGAPNAPTWLQREAKAEWKRIAPQLEEAKLLTHADRMALALLCEMWAHWVNLNRAVAENGYTVARIEMIDIGKDEPVPSKKVKPNPEVAQFMAATTQVCNLLRAFGLTPQARSGMNINTPQQTEKDLWRELAERQAAKKRQTGR